MACPSFNLHNLLSKTQLLLLVSGKMGSGKDFICNKLFETLSSRTTTDSAVQIKLFRIGNVTKCLYGKKFNVSVDRLINDREFKETHRRGLTDLYEELRSQDEMFEVNEVCAQMKNTECNIACVVDLRMQYELEAFRSRVPTSQIIHVKIVTSNEARVRRSCESNNQTESSHVTEIDLDGIVPDLIFHNDLDCYSLGGVSTSKVNIIHSFMSLIQSEIDKRSYFEFPPIFRIALANNEESQTKVHVNDNPFVDDESGKTNDNPDSSIVMMAPHKKSIMASLHSLQQSPLAQERGSVKSIESSSFEHAEHLSNVNKFLETSLLHKEEYECVVLGVTFLCHPQVMSPKYSYSPTFCLRHLPASQLQGLTLCDMGCGNGVLGLYSALKFGASKVWCLDINPFAVSTTRENAKRLQLQEKVINMSDST
jgi:phosphomevalonate kinase